jgi:hypothetical protein
MKKTSARIDAYRAVDQDRREAKMRGKVYVPGKAHRRGILSKQQREVATTQAQEVMSAWVKTPFEREAETRHAIRSSFCLGGHNWSASDEEAERITSQALAAMGAQRPGWDEGQPNFATSEDYCQWCNGPRDLGTPGKYCCRECAGAAIAYRDFKHRSGSDRAYSEALRAFQRFSTPTKECKWCTKSFHPRRDQKTQQFCSNTCSAFYKSQIQRERAGVVSTCSICKDEFSTKRPGIAQYCSGACKDAGGRILNGSWEPKQLTKQVFERLLVGCSFDPRQ